jgi:hypothetical protein
MMRKPSEPELDVRRMSAEQLLHLGVQHIAYVKTATDEDGAPRYVVCTAEGAELGAFASRDVAFAAVRQHDLEPVSLH